MIISGFKKQSFIDYPGKICSVIFTQGCNFRCPFCHNPELVLPEMYTKPYSNEYIFKYLQKYKNLLDAVCITGGEPTLHKDLPEFIHSIKDLNLKIKLDTNGTNPEMVNILISNKLVDFVAMDIKHILEYDLYNNIVGNCISTNTFNNILKTINIIENSNIEFQFRTTIIKEFHSVSDIKKLINQFNQYYKLQQFNNQKTLINNTVMTPFTDAEFNKLLEHKNIAINNSLN